MDKRIAETTHTGPTKLQAEFFDNKIRSIFGGEKKLVLASGTANIDNRKVSINTVCLENTSNQVQPLSIMEYITSDSTGLTIFPEDITWDKIEPIELDTASQKTLFPKDDLKKLQLILATSMRMEGKRQDEIIAQLVSLEEESQNFRI